MGLIDKFANLYFLVARRLVEFANLQDGITEKQIRTIVDKYGVLEDNTDFANAIIGRESENNKFSGIRLFEYDEGCKKYRSIVKNLPVVLSDLERHFLNEVLAKSLSRAFVGLVTAEKLKITQEVETEAVASLRQCVTAIREDKWIVFDNVTADGIKHGNQHLKPQKIEVSADTHVRYVSGYCSEAGRLIKCNLDRMTIRNIVCHEDIDLAPMLSEKRVDEPIRLRIENSKGATDRAFNMFSGYEKEGFFDKTTGYYILDVHYYRFEERVLIEKVLSLGAAAVVVSPSNIVEIIKRRVQEQVAKLT